MLSVKKKKGDKIKKKYLAAGRQEEKECVHSESIQKEKGSERRDMRGSWRTSPRGSKTLRKTLGNGKPRHRFVRSRFRAGPSIKGEGRRENGGKWLQKGGTPCAVHSRKFKERC